MSKLNRFEELEEGADMADEEEHHRDELKSAGRGNAEEEEQLLTLGPSGRSIELCFDSGAARTIVTSNSAVREK